MSRRDVPRVVVLGAGFAGLAAAEQLGRGPRVTVVDRRRHFEFLPNIHELVSGVKKPADLRLPADRIVRRAGHRFVAADVEGIDTAARRVELAGRRPVSYDALIVALGGVNASHGVPGVDEHAMPFKSVAECARIGRRLVKLAREREPQPVVIVGGGLEGVEALGEILRRHDGEGGRFRLHVVEARPHLLPEAPAALGREIRRLARAEGVELHLGARVARVGEDAVELDSGLRLPSRATIWTGGPAPPPLLAASGLASPGAWAPVADTLQSEARAQVFVAGDAAALPTPLAKQAYHALDMGRCAADNAVRHLAGRRLRAFRPSEKPMLLSFGDRSGFLVAGGRALAGPALAAAKEGVYELVMAQLDRRAVWDAGPAALARLSRAARELAAPAVSSPSAFLRMGQLSLL